MTKEIPNINAFNFIDGVQEINSEKKIEKNTTMQKVNEELELYKMKLKKAIQELIDNNKLKDAKSILSEYESVIKDDADIISMKAVIAVTENRFYDAKDILIKGTKLFNSSFDLFYNLAYVYELIGEYYNSIYTYDKASKLSNDMDLITQINSRIDEIKKANISDSCEIIIKNTDNKIAPKPGDNIYEARKNVSEAMLKKDAPLVSVYVLAYNNLERYTKTCVECILKYTTDINYELILIDNGSTDGTFEYFKSVKHPRKKIIKVTKNIGPTYGLYEGYKNCDAKYFVLITNDIFVTKNWLSNMLNCCMSDDKIGMVNPGLDNVSNLQAIDLGYKDFQDMQKKATEYNASDPRKWEERIRLITLGTLFKKECIDVIGYMDYGFFHDFLDDDISFRVRRAGYKAILCKDTFICHAGTVTDKGAEIAEQSLLEGKKTFKKKYYEIDPWKDVNYDLGMMQYLQSYNSFYKDTPKVLGIDVACGAQILQIKNRLRNQGIFNVRLFAFSTEAKYWLDLKTVCDDRVEVDRIEFVSEHFCEEKFNYIVIGKSINLYRDPYKLMSEVLELLSDEGQVLLKIKNSYSIKMLLKIIGISSEENEEKIVNLSIDGFHEFLKTRGFYIKDMTTEMYNVDEDFKKTIKNTNLKFVSDDDYNKALVDNYVLNIVKC